MIRAAVVVACFTYGLAYALAENLCRILLWAFAVSIVGAAVGVHPALAIALCIVGNVFGRFLYPDRA